jgi:hypothetical protein
MLEFRFPNVPERGIVELPNERKARTLSNVTYGELREAVTVATQKADEAVHALDLARQAAITAINAEYDGKVRKVRRDLRSVTR